MKNLVFCYGQVVNSTCSEILMLLWWNMYQTLVHLPKIQHMHRSQKCQRALPIVWKSYRWCANYLHSHQNGCSVHWSRCWPQWFIPVEFSYVKDLSFLKFSFCEDSHFQGFSKPCKKYFLEKIELLVSKNVKDILLSISNIQIKRNKRQLLLSVKSYHLL